MPRSYLDEIDAVSNEMQDNLNTLSEYFPGWCNSPMLWELMYWRCVVIADVPLEVEEPEFEYDLYFNRFM